MFRSRVIFSPFVSPIEGVSMLGMMGCSMTAASQANSMRPEDEDEVAKKYNFKIGYFIEVRLSIFISKNNCCSLFRVSYSVKDNAFLLKTVYQGGSQPSSPSPPYISGVLHPPPLL
jgi:hypothetical protein